MIVLYIYIYIYEKSARVAYREINQYFRFTCATEILVRFETRPHVF